MIVTRREFLAAAALPAVIQPPSAAPTLPVQPLGTREALRLGDDRDGFLYLPKGYTAGTAMPLLFMLHGAGNTALSVQYSLPLADQLSRPSRPERHVPGRVQPQLVVGER